MKFIVDEKNKETKGIIKYDDKEEESIVFIDKTTIIAKSLVSDKTKKIEIPISDIIKNVKFDKIIYMENRKIYMLIYTLYNTGIILIDKEMNTMKQSKMDIGKYVFDVILNREDEIIVLSDYMIHVYIFNTHKDVKSDDYYYLTYKQGVNNSFCYAKIGDNSIRTNEIQIIDNFNYIRYIKKYIYNIDKNTITITK